jgi:hypothetical protein
MCAPKPPSLKELRELFCDPTKALAEAFSASPRLYALLRFIVNDRQGRNMWQALRSEKELDRDKLVVFVWEEVEKRPEIEEKYHSFEYHRLWLFEWFLRRYDIRRAREVVGGGASWAQRAHFVLLLAVLATFVLRLSVWRTSHQTHWALLFCGFAYSMVLIALARSFRDKLPDKLEAFAVATHSLIPRLAGAGAVGLVILAASQELLKVVINTNWWWLVALLLAGYGYLLLEMARRIHPMPRWARLRPHGFDVACTALAHSTTLALLAEGALRKVLSNDGRSHPPLEWSQLLSIAVFVFTIGLVVNLIWAEQPVTEPL